MTVARDFTFTLPTSKDELVAKFLSVSEGPQRLLLAAMKLEAEQQGNQQVGELLASLRGDEQTREIVARLESTRYVKLPKSKARRRK